MQKMALFLVPGLSLIMAGCGAGGPALAKLYPVTGKVTVGGKPLADCTVQFVAIGKAGGFSGKIESDGSYTLADMKDGRPGAEIGKYKVIFQMDPRMAQRAMESGQMSGPAIGAGAPAAPFPDEFKQADTSPKEVEVTSGSNTINIEIP
jgi:hypothetical protein